MELKRSHEFTRYEIARIIGARALQIAMDAPLLLKINDEELKEMHYDALSIAQKEFEEGVLPIAIDRPSPQRKKERLTVVKQETVTDEELVQKEKEVEKEIVESAEELGFVQDDEAVASVEAASEEE